MDRLLLLTCVLWTAACATHRPPALPAAEPAPLGFDEAALARIEPALQAFVDSGKVSGIHAVIARRGQIVYERTLGWRDVASRTPLRRADVFRIYSMTKPVVAVGILQLVERGRVSLDDPVSKYIPAFAHVKVFVGGTADAPELRAPATPITIRQLLNHTSGIAYGTTRAVVDTIYTRARLYRASRPLHEFADSLAAIPLHFDPGTRYSYSAGLDVAGRVIEVVSGQPLDAYLEQHIFAPLGMRDTGFRITPAARDRLTSVYETAEDGSLRAMYPAGDALLAMFEPEAVFLWGSGGLLSTADDYLRFAQMLLNGGSFGGARILQPGSVALLSSNTLAPGTPPISVGGDRTYGYGLGVAVKVDTAGASRPGPAGLYRWSGYLGTYFWIDPANELIAMVWTQLSPGSRHPLEATFQQLVYSALGTAR